jgi:pyruvate kinase
MARIIETAETREQERPSIMSKIAGRQTGRVSRALCEAAAFAADEMATKLIVAFTESGLMARRLSALRPRQRIVAMTPSRDVMNELSLIWGVEPTFCDPSRSTEELLKAGERILLDAGLVTPGEIIVIMAGRLSGLGLSSSVSLYQIGAVLEESIHVSTVSDRAKPRS